MTPSPNAAMEAGGAYNVHARIQAKGIALALPLLEDAIATLPLARGDTPIVVADYGSSQGKNSLLPMGLAIKSLRKRISAQRPIFVIHIDQATNDFNSLFRLLDEDPQSYVQRDSCVYPAAVGRSFYTSVLPPSHVDVAWSSYAVQWLSRVPALIPGHFRVTRTGAVRALFERQAAEDWASFLALRARELRPGGRLVVVQPGVDDNGLSGMERIYEDANAAIAEMVDEGCITGDERAQMVIGMFLRSRRELLAPFEQRGSYEGLTVECCERRAVPDPNWADDERDRSAEAWANKHALFFRSTFIPSLAQAIRNDPARERFADELEARLTRRLLHQLTPMNSLVQTIVLVKNESE